MNENEHIINTICTFVTKGIPLVLASIVNLQGSSPRHEGTKMVIGSNGKNCGTIGGGILEAEAINKSKAVMARQQSSFMTYDLNGTDAYSADMICGGKTFIFLDYIPPTRENSDFFKEFKESLRKNEGFQFITHVDLKGTGINVTGHSLLFKDGTIISSNDILLRKIGSALKSELDTVSTTSVVHLTEAAAIIDPVRKAKTLYCFGAGHVALPTAHIAALVGFRVVVIDDRKEFASKDRFPEAGDIIVTEDFNTIIEKLTIDTDSFIVIVTRGHQYDRNILQQAIKTSAGYIGMISSKRKRDTIFSALKNDGISESDISRVHSPIGLDCGAETPEEIAVSIVAELIMERSKS